MNIDLHFHAALSRHIGFEYEFFREKIHHAKEKGLDGLMMTDHFNIGGLDRFYTFLASEYDYTGQYFDVDGVCVFPGIEVDLLEGPHLLAGGSVEDVMVLRERLRSNFWEGSYCPAKEYFRKQEGLDFLNVFAHPFRAGREIHHIDNSLLNYFHAIGLNAKDIMTFGRKIIKRIEGVAERTGMKVVGGSDAHHSLQVGTIYNEFLDEINSFHDMINAIRVGHYHIRVDDGLEENVKEAIATKKRRMLKRQKQRGE
jgi:hypothetical protein